MSLPWLKGAISGPIRAYGLTVTAAHFSANRRGGGVRKKRQASRAGGGPAMLFVPECMRLSAVDSTAGD